MRCPILITGTIDRVIAQGPFIEDIQEALARAGYDPGGVDGLYGPRTAQALRRYQNATPDTFGDLAWQAVLPGRAAAAACATYVALGLPCDEVYCDIGIIGSWLGDQARAAAVCTAVALAADQGLISLRCPRGIVIPGLPPTTPLPGAGQIPTWVLVVGGLTLATAVGVGVWASRRKGGEARG